MTPRGAAPLIAMRQSGLRPAGVVWVNLGDFIEPAWWRWANTCNAPEILVRPEDPIDRLDLRCLVGLDVILFFTSYGDRAARLYERLQEYAAEIAVMSPAFEDDIGWRWVKGIGQIDFCASVSACSESLFVLAGDRIEAEAFAAKRGVCHALVAHIEDEAGIRQAGHGRALYVLPGARRRSDYRALVDMAGAKFLIQEVK